MKKKHLRDLGSKVYFFGAINKKKLYLNQYANLLMTNSFPNSSNVQWGIPITIHWIYHVPILNLAKD